MECHIKYSHSGIGRSIADDRKITDDLDSRAWHDATNLLNTWEYEHNSCKAIINVDWTPFLNSMEESNRITNEYYAAIDSGESLTKFEQEYASLPKQVTVICHINISGDNDLIKHEWYPKYFAEQFAYDFCLMMNLSTPGCCDFYRMKILTDNSNHDDIIKLSGYNYEMAHFDSIRKNVPKVLILPLSQVINWYKSLNIGVKQHSETNVEKALFSMLHISQLDGDIVGIVWVFHALESLFDTKVGENFTQLIKRISMLLALNPREKKQLKQKLRELYDTRSSIIHGGYQGIHPINQGIIDRSLEDRYGEGINLIDYGFSTLVACIQIMIEKKWYALEFTESMVGISTPNKSLNQIGANNAPSG